MVRRRDSGAIESDGRGQARSEKISAHPLTPPPGLRGLRKNGKAAGNGVSELEGPLGPSHILASPGNGSHPPVPVEGTEAPEAR